MYKIIIKGEVQTNGKNLKELNGIDCQDNFAEFFDDNLSNNILEIKSGYMSFKFTDNKLWTYTIYNSSIELSNKELKELLEYTVGQWSDGIGEGFEQFPCLEIDNEEIFISPWFRGQIVNISQIKT